MGFQLLELNGEADNFADGGGRAAAGRVPADDLGLDSAHAATNSLLVNHLKGVSSRMLRKEFPELPARGAHLWTPSYFAASAGGAQIERLREYGEAQEKPSKSMGFVSQNSH